MQYNNYLHNQGYATASIQRYERTIVNYQKWCDKYKYNPQLLDYKTLLQYIQHLQTQQLQPITLNNEIRAIKYYCDYLIQQNIRYDNPATGITIKQQRTKVLSNLLSSDELEDLYYSYPTEDINDFYFTTTAKRNKVITGLIVYQALNNASLKALQLEHLQLYKGKIYIPSSRKSSSRTLELKPWQVIELLEYINEYRPKIQAHINNYSESLFPLNSNQFGNILTAIFKKLKTINHKVTNINQLRASVITNWLSQKNIREVQIMAGHRYIGSTEKYLQDNLESLQDAIKNFHPLQ